MSSDLAVDLAEPMAPMEPESPQPLPLTADSSRCTSPLSLQSDANGSVSSGDEHDDDENVSNTTLNLSLPIMKLANSGNNSNSNNNNNNNNTNSNGNSNNNNNSPYTLNSSKNNSSSMKQSMSPSMGAHHHHIINQSSDPNGSMRSNHKMKSDNNNHPSGSSSRGKSKMMTTSNDQMSFAADYASIPNPHSPEFVQLLLEYRQVLLDVLAKSILFADNESGDNTGNKSVTLPLKCSCGFTSKLSNQVTRSSTYVHQLELRFRSLMESTRANESKYTPKRPWFINSAPFGTAYPLSAKTSLLDKKQQQQQQQSSSSSSRQSVAMGGKQVSMFRSGTSSMNSSLNGDEDDADSDDDDVNHGGVGVGDGDNNHTGNMVNMNNLSIDEINGGGGKTILEGYLESMKNAPSDDGSVDSADEKDNDDDDDDLEGPGKRIDLKTKKLVAQMQRNGSSFTNISRQMGINRKSARRVVSDRSFGMLEKKRESRIQKGMQARIHRVASQDRNIGRLNRMTDSMTNPILSKLVKQYAHSNVFAKGTNGLIVQNGGGPISVQELYHHDTIDDDMDMDEKEMIVDEDAYDDGDDEQDLEDEEDNANDDIPLKSGLDSSSIYPLALTKPYIKSRKNMSLIHGPYNGFNHQQVQQQQQSPQQMQQQAQMNNGNLSNSHLSLIQQSDRFKPYDMKMRHNTSADMLNTPHHRMSKSNQIVPQSNPSSKLYSAQQRQQQQQQQQHQQQQQQHAIKLSNLSRHESRDHHRDSSNRDHHHHHHRVKSSKLGRHGNEHLSIKESIIVPEADKNNNTTLANCNLTISASNHHTNGSTGSNSSNGNQHSPNDSSSLLPPIPTSLADSNSDSEANLMARPFVDGFPAGIMNSLNPNRATKLTLEDFNVVWQLRSQHWTHNQIRKYFEQRGKSISKSSISRIMNGKQRNFQQFFNVIPSSL